MGNHSILKKDKAGCGFILFLLLEIESINFHPFKDV